MGTFKSYDTSAYRRERRIQSLKRRLMRKSRPRLHASIILLLTGLAGFLTSFSLLHLGVSSMWLRYPVAIVAAYCVFLLLLRLWLSLRRPREWDFDVVETTIDVVDSTEITDSTVISKQSVSTVTRTQSSESTGFSFDLDLDAAWVLVIVIALLVVATSAALYVVYIAPVLLAEIMLDGILMAALYKRVKSIEHRHWVRAAIRRTVLPAILVAVFFSIGGYAMQRAAPKARSIGEVWRHVRTDERSN